MTYVKLKNLFEEQSLLNDINGILNWDMATYMPQKSRNQRVRQIQKILDYKKSIFDQIKKKELFKKINDSGLSPEDKLNLNLMKDKFEYFDIVPYEYIKKKTSLAILCEGEWRKAKLKSNFNLVKKSFKKLVDVIKIESEILSQKKDKTKYDCLLSKYDRSLTSSRITKIFSRIESFLKKNIPLILEKQRSYKSISFTENLSESEQFELSKDFMKKLGFDFSRGRIDKSSHPFCGGSSEDIRITTRYNDADSFSCFDALMHETGHAIYEQGLPKKWLHQPLGSSGGMSLHESQSLFIEMQIIKSLQVSYLIEKIIKNNFGKKNPTWNQENIYRNRKQVKKNYIRVDADEVHYPLHIMHRFKIEKKIIEEDFDVMFLPELWNQEFYNIFNIKVDSDQNGCLQDIHWFGGDFGYFPTYSIGAFIAAQIFDCIKKQNPKLENDLKKGNFLPIINWLKKNIHNHGNYYKIDELLLNVTGEKLNLKYFEKHITDRYLKEKK